MVDSLGWRGKFAVLAPSTNTSVQPEYDDMRPPGVTNHFCRIPIPDRQVQDDVSFMAMLTDIRDATMGAVDVAMSMSPDCVVMGMSAETFWDGRDGALRLQENLETRTQGRQLIMGSMAVQAALRAFGCIKRLGIITPYMPVADKQVVRFFTDIGYEVVHLKGLRCASPVLIAHETPRTLRRAAAEVSAGVDAVVQCGTTLACAAVAAQAELWREMPVIALTTAPYWHALRSQGIGDKVVGFGRLLEEF